MIKFPFTHSQIECKQYAKPPNILCVVQFTIYSAVCLQCILKYVAYAVINIHTYALNLSTIILVSSAYTIFHPY